MKERKTERKKERKKEKGIKKESSEPLQRFRIGYTDESRCCVLWKTFGVCTGVVATEDKRQRVGWVRSLRADDRSLSDRK